MDRDQLASFAEQDPDPLLELLPDGRVAYANPAARTLFADAESLGEGHPFLVGIAEFARAMREQGRGSWTRSMRVASRWYEQVVVLVPGSDRLRVYAHDDTARRRAADRLRAQRDLAIELLGLADLDDALRSVLRVALESSGMDCGAVYRMGSPSEGLRLVHSLGLGREAAARIRGFAEGQPTPARPWALGPFYSTPDSLDAAPDSQQMLREEGVRCFGVVPIHQEGQLLASVHVGSRVHTEFPYEERESLEVLAALVGHVVTRLAAQRSLRESESRYRALFETMEHGVVWQDAEGNVVAVNAAAERILGLSEAAMKARTSLSPEWGAVREDGTPFPGPDHPSMVALRTGQPVRGVVMGVHSPTEGRHVWIVVSATPQFREGQTEPYGVFTTFADMTESKRTEEERAALEEQLTQSRKLESIGQLAGGVAHDLNNMLSPILGYAEMLLDDLPAGDRHRVWAEQIAGAAERARDLVRQLLAFARRQTLDMRPLDLNALIRAFEPMLRRTIREDVAIALRLAPSVGFVDGDVGQIEQTLMNLAANAQDAMPDGGVLTIETTNVYLDESYTERRPVVAPGPYAMVSVSDTGVGMDAQTLERAFEPFFTTKELGRGTGLGLATVYGVVKQHRGYIWAYSEPGSGATFRVYLPHTQSPVADAVEPSASPSSEGTETVLLVEDQEQVRTLAGEMLDRCGYRVMSAADGEAALPLAAAYLHEIHLLVTDVILTGMDGRELYRRLKATRPGTKVLYMSGHAANVISHHGILDEGVDLIQKPFSLHTFVAKVREVLDRTAGRPSEEP